MRVLIADTDEAFLEILLPIFGRQGHETEVASDGLDCIAIMRDFQPDVVVIEAGMLWGGNEGVIALMKEDPHVFDIPVILAGESQEEFEAVSNSHPVRWLRKPFGLSELLEQLHSAVPRVQSTTRCVA